MANRSEPFGTNNKDKYKSEVATARKYASSLRIPDDTSWPKIPERKIRHEDVASKAKTPCVVALCSGKPQINRTVVQLPHSQFVKASPFHKKEAEIKNAEAQDSLQKMQNTGAKTAKSSSAPHTDKIAATTREKALFPAKSTELSNSGDKSLQCRATVKNKEVLKATDSAANSELTKVATDSRRQDEESRFAEGIGDAADSVFHRKIGNVARMLTNNNAAERIAPDAEKTAIAAARSSDKIRGSEKDERKIAGASSPESSELEPNARRKPLRAHASCCHQACNFCSARGGCENKAHHSEPQIGCCCSANVKSSRRAASDSDFAAAHWRRGGARFCSPESVSLLYRSSDDATPDDSDDDGGAPRLKRRRSERVDVGGESKCEGATIAEVGPRGKKQPADSRLFKLKTAVFFGCFVYTFVLLIPTIYDYFFYEEEYDAYEDMSYLEILLDYGVSSFQEALAGLFDLISKLFFQAVMR